MQIQIAKNDNGAESKVNLNTAPHILIAGGVRSGKTTTLKHLINKICEQGPNSKFSFGSSTPFEFETIANKLSQYPLVAPVNSATSIGELHFAITDTMMNLVRPAMDEMKRRKDLFATTYKNSTGAANLEEYNKIAKDQGMPQLERFFLIIDGIDHFLKWLSNDLEKSEMIKGSPIHSFQTLVRSGASLGIHVIATLNDPALSVLTPALKANFTSRILHSLNEEQISALKIAKDQIPDRSGEFIMMSLFSDSVSKFTIPR